ncbi:MAG: ribosomal protein S18-alanine N-acetyltransferase [Chloroflexi bacterium]|nr:ribosomal protein S18-alanine N-acetyltransferase [Chloroflexota bacterium]MCY3938482.1 ribosomal protein S18-alanine N-acetyltransferase [Chloroflexota bacterium]
MVSTARSRTGRETWIVEPMRLEDLDRVREIERRSFSTPWPRDSYRNELVENRMAHYVVLRREGPDPEEPELEAVDKRPGFWRRILGRSGDRKSKDVVGFAGIWFMVDEAHITTVAIDPDWRGRGLGELLLLALIEKSIAINASLITLEVRVSNDIAQRLYYKYGFYSNGVRPRYYSDNGEDALVMWSEEVGSLTFRRRLEKNKAALGERIEWKQTL